MREYMTMYPSTVRKWSNTGKVEDVSNLMSSDLFEVLVTWLRSSGDLYANG